MQRGGQRTAVGGCSSTCVRPRRPTSTAQETAGEAEGLVEEAAWHALPRGRSATPSGPRPRPGRRAWSAGWRPSWSWTALDWPMSLLRRIWEALLEFEAGRRKSAEHEARWLNLLGFALRPGLRRRGRRLAGERDVADRPGQAGARDRRLPDRVLDPLAADRRRAVRRAAAGPGRSAAGLRSAAGTAATTTGKGGGRRRRPAAIARDVAAAGLAGTAGRPTPRSNWATCWCELLHQRSLQPARPAIVWALGRIGAREPVYGPLNGVVAGRRGRPVARPGAADARAERGREAGGHAAGTPDRRPLSRSCRRSCATKCSTGCRDMGSRSITCCWSARAGPSTARSRAGSSAKRCPKACGYGEAMRNQHSGADDSGRSPQATRLTNTVRPCWNTLPSDARTESQAQAYGSVRPCWTRPAIVVGRHLLGRAADVHAAAPATSSCTIRPGGGWSQEFQTPANGAGPCRWSTNIAVGVQALRANAAARVRQIRAAQYRRRPTSTWPCRSANPRRFPRRSSWPT